MEQLRIKSLFIAIALSLNVHGQIINKEKIFYDTRIVNGHSVETNNPGVLKFIISHRFGRINSGIYELFGLDNSTIRIGLDYGVNQRLTIGVGRSSFEKTIDGFVKYKWITQNSSRPLSITTLIGINSNGERRLESENVFKFKHRISYNYHLLIARRFSDRFSFQIMPSILHRNLVATRSEKNTVFSMGLGERFLISKNISLTLEYYHTFNYDTFQNHHQHSLSFGVDIETKGHVFQLHLSNSRGMIEKFFISETTGSWTEGDIHFGFNITRDFKLKGKK